MKRPPILSDSQNIAKIAKLSKATYKFNTIPIKTLTTLFGELEEAILTLIQKHKRTRGDTTILSGKNNIGHITA